MRRLNITDGVLDKLGFSEYWDEHGTWGGRTLKFSNGTQFRIIEQCEMDDEDEGYGYEKVYTAQHFYFSDWFAIPKIDSGNFDLFFLHEMYECINKCYPNCIDEFVLKCKSLNMGIYIEDYLNNKSIKTNTHGNNND